MSRWLLRSPFELVLSMVPTASALTVGLVATKTGPKVPRSGLGEAIVKCSDGRLPVNIFKINDLPGMARPKSRWLSKWRAVESLDGSVNGHIAPQAVYKKALIVCPVIRSAGRRRHALQVRGRLPHCQTFSESTEMDASCS